MGEEAVACGSLLGIVPSLRDRVARGRIDDRVRLRARCRGRRLVGLLRDLRLFDRPGRLRLPVVDRGPRRLQAEASGVHELGVDLRQTQPRGLAEQAFAEPSDLARNTARLLVDRMGGLDAEEQTV